VSRLQPDRSIPDGRLAKSDAAVRSKGWLSSRADSSRPDEALRYVDTAVTVRCQLSGSDARYPLRIEVCRSGAFVPLCRMSLMMRDPDLFMLVAAMTCGPELAPESCFANEVREKMLSSV
jgi:hypothetical protein